MFFGREEAENWLPFIKAVAFGKSIEKWSGYMEKIDDTKPADYYSDNPNHRCTINIDGTEETYATPKDREWIPMGNNINTEHSGHQSIYDPSVYYRIV